MRLRGPTQHIAFLVVAARIRQSALVRRAGVAPDRREVGARTQGEVRAPKAHAAVPELRPTVAIQVPEALHRPVHPGQAPMTPGADRAAALARMRVPPPVRPVLGQPAARGSARNPSQTRSASFN